MNKTTKLKLNVIYGLCGVAITFIEADEQVNDYLAKIILNNDVATLTTHILVHTFDETPSQNNRYELVMEVTNEGYSFSFLAKDIKIIPLTE